MKSQLQSLEVRIRGPDDLTGHTRKGPTLGLPLVDLAIEEEIIDFVTLAIENFGEKGGVQRALDYGRHYQEAIEVSIINRVRSLE